MAELIALSAAAFCVLAALVILVSRDWRWTIAALGLLYPAVFILVNESWSTEMALVKLVAGWMSTAVIAATIGSVRERDGQLDSGPSGRMFRLLAGGFILLLVAALLPEALLFIPATSSAQAAGGLILLVIGLLLLGLTGDPLRVIVGLLVVFAGFEIFYSAVESSVLVAGLLAAVNLALAMLGSYLVQYSRQQGDAA